ncbi:MAG: ABC transporter ATP-binding protein/permease [Anaerolineae bacterium]|nr:ABC transporter ATP-binding protein/permease [Anaerolineae bacterium]MDW8172345.1 ABC transporter ATP-binding protein [Anaerolineae bacterium]
MFHGGGWWTYLNSEEGKPPTVTRALLSRVLSYARPYRLAILGMLAAISATTGLGLLTPLIFRELIDGALQPPGDAARLNLLALGLVAIPLLSSAISIGQRKLNATVGEGVIYDLRLALYEHLQRMSLRFFTHTKTGELVSRLNNDVVGAQNAISNTLVTIATNFITVVATAGVMLALEWRLTLLGVMVMPFFIWAARRMGGRLRAIIRQQMDSNAQMNAMVSETLNISGALLVKLFGRAPMEVERFRVRAADVRQAGIRRAVLGTQFFIIIGLVSVMGTALVYWVGGHLVLSGEFTVGTIVAFGTYLTQLYGPLQALTNAPVDFATSMLSFERVFEIIDLPREIADKPDALRLEQVRGELEFRNVSFVYALDEDAPLREVTRHGRSDSVRAVLGGDRVSGHAPAAPSGHHQAREAALQAISFKLQPGQVAALVGPSGAGKTTLTYLIPRLYDPTEGAVLLDGHDLRDLTLDSLVQHIGMVTQETYLFHDTIRTNLLYAKLDAAQAELEDACRAANIHDFIMGLPQGYDTVVGERGYRLSGGEKQRLAIARVILKNPRLLVLDEATSSLDSQSEALIQEALGRLQQGRTTIVIAHRLSTILTADLILVMDRGQIVERGRHDDLLARGGLYASLYETQFRHERERLSQV